MCISVGQSFPLTNKNCEKLSEKSVTILPHKEPLIDVLENILSRTTTDFPCIPSGQLIQYEGNWIILYSLMFFMFYLVYVSSEWCYYT